MRLKSLRLHGFKSFPDKTEINFNSGITVVVGPNGSGKSNVSDAVRWVLGETSSKSIRGSKMEDVIFGGSDSRRPMSFAEVSLVIDNTEGLGRLDTEYDEVTVTRRYFRSGDSEYLINERPVRLRDINELFMNTGVGRSGYSVIGQGKIAEIISLRSEERRNIFEEAAGISKYRYKKNEAERKLAETEANALRLSDILEELQKRVGPLEKEAAAAKKYLELYEKKKEADVSLWLYDVGEMKKKLGETEKKYIASKLELESADNDISDLETASEKLYAKSMDAKAASDEIDRKISERTEKKHELDSSGRVLENDISHIKESIEKLKIESEIKSAALSDAKTRADEARTSIASKQGELDAARQSFDKLRELAEKHSSDARKINEEVENNEILASRTEAKITELRVSLSALTGSRESDGGRLESIKAEIAELSDEIALVDARIERAKKSIADYDAAIATSKTKVAGATETSRELAQKIESLEKELAQLRLEYSSKRQRAETLRRMDELLEGYNYSVKNVMNASGKGELSGIFGPVSRIIKVDGKYGIAIETALGANIQNIVTRDERAAKDAIAYLKRTNGGRATFYPVTSVKSRQIGVSESELKKSRGYIGIASELTEFDPKFSEVMGYMLGGTAVFDNIENASETAKRLGYKIRIVTLDGQLINAGGSFTGGSVKRDSGMLTRTSEISKIESESKAILEKTREIESKIGELADKKSDLDSTVAAENDKISVVSTLKNAEETQMQVLIERVDGGNRRKAALEDDISGIDEHGRKFEAECERLGNEIKKFESEKKTYTDLASELSEQRMEADRSADSAKNECNLRMIEITALQKDVESLTASLDLNETTAQTLMLELERNSESAKSLKEKLASAIKTIDENKSSFDKIGDDIEKLRTEREKIIAEILDLEKNRTEIGEKIKDKTHSRELIFRDYTRLESMLENMRGEQDRIAAKIWEDYELTYGTAIELGYPEVTADNRGEIFAAQSELKNKIKALGNVNVNAIDEYAEVKERFDFTSAQFKDLTEAKEGLYSIIDRLETEMRTKFTEAIADINRNFKQTFKELFGGGNAEISLTDPDNVLSCGIDINVAPPGKIIKSLISLSGGEQAFVAIALIFAILNVNPTPFCIFDEIEAALDDVNVVRYADYMKRYSEKTQFVVITHRRGTMEASDTIYGVTMAERGISKVLGINVNDVEEKLGVKAN